MYLLVYGSQGSFIIGYPYPPRQPIRLEAHREESRGRDSGATGNSDSMEGAHALPVPTANPTFGERGSGRTSLINAISSQTNERFIGTYWHSEDPLNCALDELAITFCGYEIPPTMHQKVERVVETLDSGSGPSPRSPRLPCSCRCLIIPTIDSPHPSAFQGASHHLPFQFSAGFSR